MKAELTPPSSVPPEGGAGRTSLWFAGSLVVVLVAAALLRFDGLVERELWFDEACTFYAVDHLFHFPENGPEPRSEVAHWPYFFLLRLWTGAAGNSAWGLRSFSAVCGVVGVALLGLLLARCAGRRVGLIAAVLAAVHPLHVYYSQEARVYALWTMEATLALFLLLSAARSGRLRAWIAYAAVAAVTVLTHYYTLFWLIGVAAAFPIVYRRRNLLRPWLVTHTALVVLLIPVIGWLILPLAQGGPAPWLAETWRGYPPWLAIPRSIWALLPSGGYPEYLGVVTVASQVVGHLYGQVASFVALWGAVVVFGALAAIRFVRGSQAVRGRNESGTAATGGGRYSRQHGSQSRGTPDAMGGGRYSASIAAFAVVSTILFLAVAFAYSAFVRPIYVVGRYDLAALPAVLVGLALLIEGVARRLSASIAGQSVLCAVATGAFVVCSGITVLGAGAVPASHDTAERARRIDEHVADDDLVISLGMYRWFMTYEWHRIGFAAEVRSFPHRHDRQLCWTDAEAELADAAAIAKDMDAVSAAIRQRLGRGDNVWLLAHGETQGARWEVDRRFFARLREEGIGVDVVDEWTGLARLRRDAP